MPAKIGSLEHIRKQYANKKSYSDLLRDPQWQKKRLSILERDSFTCQLCLDEKTELHVHHKMYIAGNDPWEYDDDNFITYCKHCHLCVEYLKVYKLDPIIATKKRISLSKSEIHLATVVKDGNGYNLVLLLMDSTVTQAVSYPEGDIINFSKLLDHVKKLEK